MNIEELARQAGINTKFWNMGAGSVLFVSFVDGIPRSNFEHYTALAKAEVLEQAAQKAESMSRVPIMHRGQGVISYGDAGSFACAQAIRAMKPNTGVER